ncbi:MAG: diadenylate cyclase CdaA [Candidatus Omnitrophota bacterium]|nr:diadenylate cyclase CdaA [Candidatus Omnitrophota bacterium]MDZ4242197.1 diadenylate cyclase CdaA [Candidatus Omnitrophota bacterium]
MRFFVIWEAITPALEMVVLWAVFYRILVFFWGTRSFQVLKGIIYLILAFFFFQFVGFNTLNWLLTKFFAISIIAFLIIFQQELRQGLARLGQQHLFNITLEESEIMAVFDKITTAIYKLSKNNVGCLIAMERESKLKTYIESGVEIDSKVSSELLQSIFMPNSPVHDGGVIIRGDRVVAASCLFPLSDNPNFNKIIGTRHRAALGLTEQTDAVVLMISEETAEISVAVDGRFIPVVDRDKLVNILKDLFLSQNKKKK